MEIQVVLLGFFMVFSLIYSGKEYTDMAFKCITVNLLEKNL